jgi:hypothetical protein
MIKFTEETHKKFCEDVEFANQFLVEFGARVITEFWRQSIPTLRREVGETYEMATTMSDFFARHPEVKDMGPDFFEDAVDVKRENPNATFSEVLEKAWAKRAEQIQAPS